MDYRLSQHAKQEIERRCIPHELIENVMKLPEQIVPGYGGRKAYQSILDFDKEGKYLLRIIVDDQVDPMLIVTANKTSRIGKYWSQ